MHRLNITAFLLILLLSGSAFSQISGKLTGKAVDKESKLPLPGARIFIEGTKSGTISDSRGEFAIVDVPSGSQTVRIRYIGYKEFSMPVNIVAGSTAYLLLEVEPGSVRAGEITVIGDGQKGTVKALNQQKNNINISNIVSSDQIGRFPDANIGDAMKRISGITVQYDQGEARFGLIRGAASSLNSVTINGDRIPSAEGETRSVQLDLIPADMVQAIEVSKTVTPDMDADAIGGSVNLVTRAVPNDTRLSFTAAGGYNFLSGNPIWTGGIIYGTRFAEDKLGLMISGSYNNHHLGSDNIEAEWRTNGNNVWMGDFQVREYDVFRIRQSVSLAMDYNIDNANSILFNAIYNHRDDWENRYRLRYRMDESGADDNEDGRPDANGQVKEMEIVRETKGGLNDDINDMARLEDQRTYNFSLSGKHLFGDLNMSWQGNYAQASEERPHERYISYRTDNATVAPNTGNTEKPFVSMLTNGDITQWELDDLIEQYQWTREKDANGRLDFQLPLDLFEENGTIIKFGGRIRTKDKLRENNYFTYSPEDGSAFDATAFNSLTDQTNPDFLAGDYKAGRFISKEYLGSLDLDNTSLFEKEDERAEYLSLNYTAKETISSGYAMLSQNFSGDFTVLLGARIENTEVNYTANKYDIDADTVTGRSGTSTVTNFLPNLQLKYNIDPSTIFRLAFTNTLARPSYFQLAPFRQYSFEDNELSEGNPALKPTESMNLDLIAERYFETIGIMSAGVFYKDIKNFIFDYVQEDYLDPVSGQTFGDYIQARNGAKASIYGFELNFMRNLDDVLPFAGFTILANYTYTKSSTDGLPLPGRENEDVPLAGTAGNMINGSLSYEDDVFNFRLSLNYTSDYIDEYGEEAFFDRYYDKQLFVDLNGSAKLYQGLRVFFEANNLTNQPLRYFQGISSRTMQAEYYSSRFNAGFKYDF